MVSLNQMHRFRPKKILKNCLFFLLLLLFYNCHGCKSYWYNFQLYLFTCIAKQETTSLWVRNENVQIGTETITIILVHLTAPFRYQSSKKVGHFCSEIRTWWEKQSYIMIRQIIFLLCIYMYLTWSNASLITISHLICLQPPNGDKLLFQKMLNLTLTSSWNYRF